MNLEQFNDTGFFDENFFIYFEEIDLCKRLVEKNKKIFLDTNIKIFHAGGTSHEDDINFEMEKSRNWHWMWSTFYFHKKHYGYFFSLTIHFSKLLRFAFNCLRFFFISKDEFKKNKFRFLGLISSIIGVKSKKSVKILENF